MDKLCQKQSTDQGFTTPLYCEHPSERRSVVPLDKNWYFRQTDNPDSTYLETQGFPTEIHVDLLHHGIIPDPFIGKQENDVQWVGEKSWTYRTRFWSPSPNLHGPPQKSVIVFEGLDTYATIVINGEIVGKSEDMFLPLRIDVTEKLSGERDNILEIIFESTFLIGKKIVEKDPEHKWGCWNGDPSRLAVRKAQYHYGWDWGPALLTCGPWKPIYIETYRSRISDLCFTTDLSESLDTATVVAKLDFEGPADHVKFELSIDGNCTASHVETLRSSRKAEAVMRTNKPRLWYPCRYGDQPLYTITATLWGSTDGCIVILDTKSKRFGLRKAKVIQQKLDEAPGTTFMFEINNIRLFCGGSNWIPAHSFQTLLDPAKYRAWVKLAVDGNQIMLRVWGGGIYEQDAFYEACDEMGILVWQDFLFACGNYPAADVNFVNLIEKEAIANVKHLRHHPCIVLWAGNNEDYQYRETENLEYDPQDQNPSNWLKSTFPARYIYEKVLKDVTTELTPDTYYHFGSPYGGKDTTDPTVGDLHQWNVWHGSQEKYQNFDNLAGRFVSEFGIEAYPDMSTVDKFLINGQRDIDRYPQSSTVELHNKAAGHERRLALYLAENIRYTLEPFEQYVYCTQLVQAEAIGTAYRLWKRQWKGPGREFCAGALVWQMNDCWPTISWSIIDHYLRPKLAYYAVKREMEPLTVSMKRTVRTIPADKYTRAFVKTVHELEIWACNLTLENKTVHFDFKEYTFSPSASSSPNAEIRKSKEHYPSTEFKPTNAGNPTLLLPNRSTEITKLIIPTPSSSDSNPDSASQTIILTRMFSVDDDNNNNRKYPKLLAHALSWPDPLKHIHLTKPSRLHLKLSMDPLEENGAIPLRPSSPPPDWWCVPNNVCFLLIRSDVPLKGVKIEVDGDDDEHVRFDDQGFDVMNDETVSVRVWGLGVGGGDEGRVRVRYLGM